MDLADEKAALNLYPVAMPDPGPGSVAVLAGGRIFYFKNLAAFDEANTRLAALEKLPGPHTGPQALFGELDTGFIDDGVIDLGALEEGATLKAWTGTPRDMDVILVDLSDMQGDPTDSVELSNSLNTTIS